MISYIKGTVIAKGPDYIIAEAGGIGYKVHVAESSLAAFLEGKQAELFCYLRLKREETLELYGLPSREGLDLFETLNNISGIGPRAALALASLGTKEQLREAIQKGDASFFRGVPGIGQKKVQKVILELTGKLKSLSQDKKESSEHIDVVEALVSLGFSKREARQAVSQLPDNDSSVQERVQAALKLVRR